MEGDSSMVRSKAFWWPGEAADKSMYPLHKPLLPHTPWTANSSPSSLLPNSGSSKSCWIWLLFLRQEIAFFSLRAGAGPFGTISNTECCQTSVTWLDSYALLCRRCWPPAPSALQGSALRPQLLTLWLPSLQSNHQALYILSSAKMKSVISH